MFQTKNSCSEWHFLWKPHIVCCLQNSTATPMDVKIDWSIRFSRLMARFFYKKISFLVTPKYIMYIVSEGKTFNVSSGRFSNELLPRRWIYLDLLWKVTSLLKSCSPLGKFIRPNSRVPKTSRLSQPAVLLYSTTYLNSLRARVSQITSTNFTVKCSWYLSTWRPTLSNSRNSVTRSADISLESDGFTSPP